MSDVKNEDQKSQTPVPSPVSNPAKEVAPIPTKEVVASSSEARHEITPELSDMRVKETPFPHDQIKIESDPKSTLLPASVLQLQGEIDAPLRVDTAIIEAANPDKNRSMTWLGAVIKKALEKFRQRKKLQTPVAQPV